MVKQEPLVCTPKSLPRSRLVEAAHRARAINPTNHPPIEHLARVARGLSPTPMRIAVLTTKYWGAAGVKLTAWNVEGHGARRTNTLTGDYLYLKTVRRWVLCFSIQYGFLRLRQRSTMVAKLERRMKMGIGY